MLLIVRESLIRNQQVAGSIPAGGSRKIKHFDVSSPAGSPATATGFKIASIRDACLPERGLLAASDRTHCLPCRERITRIRASVESPLVNPLTTTALRIPSWL